MTEEKNPLHYHKQLRPSKGQAAPAACPCCITPCRILGGHVGTTPTAVMTVLVFSHACHFEPKEEISVLVLLEIPRRFVLSG